MCLNFHHCAHQKIKRTDEGQLPGSVEVSMKSAHAYRSGISKLEAHLSSIKSQIRIKIKDSARPQQGRMEERKGRERKGKEAHTKKETKLRERELADVTSKTPIYPSSIPRYSRDTFKRPWSGRLLIAELK